MRLCAICYHLFNFKNVKYTHEGIFLLVKLQASSCNCIKSNIPCVFFMHFTLYKWYQIAQSISCLTQPIFTYSKSKMKISGNGRMEIYSNSKLTIKTPEQCRRRCSGVSLVNSEQNSISGWNESLFNTSSASATEWSDKQFVGFYRGTVWACLTILWHWCLKG